MDRDVLEKALRGRISDAYLTEDDVTDVLDYIDEDDETEESIARALWTMGGVAGHNGCRYEDGDYDADYQNDCPTCQLHLRAVARDVLADGTV